MQDVFNTLDVAHQQLKNLAVQGIQQDQEIQHILDCIKAVYALKQVVGQYTQQQGGTGA